MATLNANGHEIYFEEHGSPKAPAIVLSPLIYTNTTVYDSVIRMLSDDFRVIAYDYRGAGRSKGPASPSIDESVSDATALIEKLGVGPCHFVGNCLGAFVGMQLAISRPWLLKSCVLMGALPEANDKDTLSKMDAFIDNAKAHGMKDSAEAFAETWFGATFKATKDPIQVTRRERWLREIAHLGPEEVEAARQIFHRNDVTKDLDKIRCELLVIAGDEDSATSLASYKKLVNAVPGAEFKLIHHAGYALVIEQPEEVAECIRNFCQKVDRHLTHRSKQTARDLGARSL
ncbi:MAG: alpha/beta fold hydrolase [Bdellovibrio sp.]